MEHAFTLGWANPLRMGCHSLGCCHGRLLTGRIAGAIVAQTAEWLYVAFEQYFRVGRLWVAPWAAFGAAQYKRFFSVSVFPSVFKSEQT